MRSAAAVAVAAAGLAACTTAPKDAGFSNVAALTRARAGAEPVWVGRSVAEAEAQNRVGALLAEPLTEASAVEIALLSNRDLRAAFYAMKAARGDLIDAGRPPNPFVSAVAFDVAGTPMINYGASVSFELLQLLFMPRAIKAAKAEYGGAQAMGAAAVIDLAADVRAAFYEALAARQIAELFTQAEAATAASAEAARARYEAGNIAEVDLRREELMAEETRVAAVQARLAAATAREGLNGLLGLDGEAAAQWTLAGRLAPPPEDELSTDAPAAAAAEASAPCNR